MPPSEPGGRPVRWWFAGLGCLVLAAVVGAGVGVSPASTAVGDVLAAVSCRVTGCSGGGMALIGWMLVLGVPVFGIVTWVLFPRSGVRGRIVLLVLGMLTATFVFLMLPDPRDQMTGDGAAALGDGMLWGFGTVVVGTVLLLVALLFNRMISGSGIVPFFAVSTTLILGGIFAFIDNHDDDDDAVIMTTHIFPDVTMRIEGDDLTRVSATDRTGCAGRYPGCGHTAEFEYTTTDSDAVVHLEIVWFPSAVDAWDAEQTVPPSADPTALRVSSVNHEHVLVSTVRHADGRPIERADEPWLRWPHAQLDYAFRLRWGFKRVYSLEPTSTAAPRTP